MYTKAVIIGRFNPVMHNGHIRLVEEALKVSKRVYIIIGSFSAFPDVKNPIRGITRQCNVVETINQHFPQDVRRIFIKTVDDSKYNEERWKANIRTAISEMSHDIVAMVGFEKDKDSYWLHEFGWTHVPVQPVMLNDKPMSSTFVRDAWLRYETVIHTDMMPAYSARFLKNFIEYNKEEFQRLHEERIHWDNEVAKFVDYPYKGTMHHVCADAVVLCNNHILLITRKFHPGKGAWALPGGHKNETETFEEAAIRELQEEVGLKVPYKVIKGSIKDKNLFDNPTRTAVHCKPTVAQFIVLQPDANGKLPKLKAGDDALEATWVPLHVVMKNKQRMFDDHACIISHFTGI